MVPVYKKGDKQILKNYSPNSPLPVCGKRFENLIFNKMFKFFIKNDLILPNQSGFNPPGDSCINQPLPITYNVCKSFGCRYELRCVFLDIMKVFDKVWHDGVTFKLE